jgi:hypothetical protein
MSPLLNPVRNKIILKNYNTPATIAGASPTLDYRFALDKTEIDAVSLTDKLTFSRSATCAFTDAGGNLALAGANVPRFTHNTSTRQSQGLLIEVNRTNFNTNSIGSNFISPPPPIFPGLNFGSFTMTAGTNFTLWSRGSLDQYGRYWIVSFYLYKTNENEINSFSLAASVYFFTSTATTTLDGITLSTSGQGSTSVSIQNLGNNLYKLVATARNGNAGGFPSVTLRANGTFSGGERCLVSHIQAEAGTVSDLIPSSYIPTTTVAVTRTETATISLAGLPATRTLVEKPAGCATISGDTLTLNTGYTIERVMVFPVSLTSEQIAAIRSVM